MVNILVPLGIAAVIGGVITIVVMFLVLVGAYALALQPATQG